MFVANFLTKHLAKKFNVKFAVHVDSKTSLGAQVLTVPSSTFNMHERNAKVVFANPLKEEFTMFLRVICR